VSGMGAVLASSFVYRRKGKQVRVPGHLSGGVRNMIQKSILVVDDEAPMRELLSINLKACGYQVQAACDGLAALELLNHQPFDLVLLDISMPELDGLQTLEIARRRFGMPIVIVSARGSEADVLAALTRGADDYVVKPFAIDELVTRVASWLGWARAVHQTEKAI
jgi:DNA-binding response OmpR family regulator